MHVCISNFINILYNTIQYTILALALVLTMAMTKNTSDFSIR